MNGYECDGTDIFMRRKMECSIQRGEFTACKYMYHRTNGKHSLFVFI